LRLAKRLTDLSDQETADIFCVAKKLQKMIETIYETNSTTLCVQDGPFAGQTIEVKMGKYLQKLFSIPTACSRTFGSKKGYGFWR
jgi:hypothetical protein